MVPGSSRFARAQTVNQRPGVEARVWWRVLAKSHVKGSSGRSRVSASGDRGLGAERGTGRRQPLQVGTRRGLEAWRTHVGRGPTAPGGGNKLGTRILVAMQQGASLLGNREGRVSGVKRVRRSLLRGPAEAGLLPGWGRRLALSPSIPPHGPASPGPTSHRHALSPSGYP